MLQQDKILKTKFFLSNGIPIEAKYIIDEKSTNQSIVFNIYGSLFDSTTDGEDPLTPQVLREFADKLEITRNSLVKT